METGTLDIHDLQIAYSITNPQQDNTIFFIHGNSSSSNAWRKQVTSPLMSGYRLITIDLPNHGKSSALDVDADYSLPGLGKIVGAAIDQLSARCPYIICSVSLGTNIVAEMPVGKTKPAGYFLAGPCIIGAGFEMDKMMLPDSDTPVIFTDNPSIEEVAKYANAVSHSTDLIDLDCFLKDYHAVKGNFRSSLYATVASGNFNDQVHLIEKTYCPVCIVFGRGEEIVNTNYLNDAPLNLWNQTIFTIAGAGHFVNIDAPDDFNELLASFSNNIFITNAPEKQS